VNEQAIQAHFVRKASHYRFLAFPLEPCPPPDREPERRRLELFCTPLFLPVPDAPGRFAFFLAPEAMLYLPFRLPLPVC
jgi:hypothetical protein